MAYGPGLPFVVKTGAIAMPVASVGTNTDKIPPGKTPEGPVAGALNCTRTLATGLLAESRTLALRRVGNIEPKATVCASP
jgi:hypothetical protein